MWYLGGDFRVGNLLDVKVGERRKKDDGCPGFQVGGQSRWWYIHWEVKSRPSGRGVAGTKLSSRDAEIEVPVNIPHTCGWQLSVWSSEKSFGLVIETRESSHLGVKWPQVSENRSMTFKHLIEEVTKDRLIGKSQELF